jgi:AraC-like DNA-binding protein
MSGTVYMTGPLITHEQLTDSSDPMDEYCIQFEISEKKGVKEGKAAQLLKDTHFWIGEDSQNMEKFFEMLDAEDAKRELGYIENVTSIVKQILIALVRNYIGSEISYDYSRITPDDKRMVIADESFLYSYASITLEDLSERLNLSSRQTQRFLKKAYGKTFIEMRTERRMEVAQKLMKKGMSASSAASAVGYEDAKSLKMCGK